MTTKLKVAILGSTGMLGSMVRRFLSGQPEYDLRVIDRSLTFDAAQPDLLELHLLDCQYAINCIGLIKPRIDDRSAPSILRAIRVNSVFPHLLAQAAEQVGTRVLQIATDCVYSGQSGSYTETAPHDALDVYGKTKSLGEVVSPAVRHLRSSIIGPEGAGRPRDSLLEWFLGRTRGTTIKGYSNHLWNGITTLAFARLCAGIISSDLFASLPPVQHIMPAGTITKAKLLQVFACAYNRTDIWIEEVESSARVDRTLNTAISTARWVELWKAAGYALPPTIPEMVEEMARIEQEVGA